MERMRRLDGIIDSMEMNLSKLQETVRDRGARCAGVHGVAEVDMTQWLNNNTSGIKVFSQEVTTGAYKVCLIKIYHWINNVTVTWMQVQLFSIAVLQYNQLKIHFGWSDKDNFVQQKVSINTSDDCASSCIRPWNGFAIPSDQSPHNDLLWTGTYYLSDHTILALLLNYSALLPLASWLLLKLLGRYQPVLGHYYWLVLPSRIFFK